MRCTQMSSHRFLYNLRVISIAHLGVIEVWRRDFVIYRLRLIISCRYRECTSNVIPARLVEMLSALELIHFDLIIEMVSNRAASKPNDE